MLGVLISSLPFFSPQHIPVRVVDTTVKERGWKTELTKQTMVLIMMWRITISRQMAKIARTCIRLMPVQYGRDA